MFYSAQRLTLASLLALLMGAVAPLVNAGPTEQQLGDLAEPLSTKVTTEFLESPLRRVAEYLQRESSVLIAVDAESTIGSDPISLKAEDMSVRAVLDYIALTTDLDWVVEEGVIFISTDDAIMQRRVVSGTYNLRGLMVHVPDYSGAPSMDLDETLSNTNSGGSTAGGGGGGGGGGLFGSDNNQELRNTVSGEAFMQMIVELIQDSTGAPDLWLDEIFTARSVQGMLIVRATPEVHEQINTMLAQLDRSLSTMLAVEAQYLVVPRSAIESLEGEYILDQAACAAFIDGLDNGNTRRLGTMRNVCHNGQRIYTFAGENQGFISDVEPIPDTASVDPTISVSRSGVTTDLTPTVAFDGRSIEVAVRSDMVHAVEIETTPVPVASHADAGAQVGNAVLGEVQVGLVSQQLTRFRTNARIPNGGAVILTASTSVFEGIDADQFEVILVVRASILESDPVE